MDKGDSKGKAPGTIVIESSPEKVTQDLELRFMQVLDKLEVRIKKDSLFWVNPQGSVTKCAQGGSGFYAPATWRCTLPGSRITGSVRIGFNLPGGETVRLEIGPLSAKHLAETLLEQGGNQPGINSQSPRSSGIPNSAGSIPDEGKNV